MLQTSSEQVRTGFILTALCCAVLVRFLLACLASPVDVAAATAPDSAWPVVLSKTQLQPRLQTQPDDEEAGTQAPEQSTDESAPSANETEQTADEPEQSASASALQFTNSDVQAVTVGGSASYAVDVASALAGTWRQTAQQAGPQVLIVHTHGTEAYTAEPGWEYAGSDGYRSDDPDYSVVRVGQALADELEKLGIETIHDPSMNDLESFSGAYSRTLTRVEQWLEEYPSICMVIDLHRDAAENPDGSQFAPTVLYNGTEYAQLMLVVGTDEGGLQHPDWRQNLSCAVQLQALLERQVPGLCRNLDLRTERFNQHLSTGSILIEFGASGNTMTQVLRTTTVAAQAIAQLLQATA